MITKPKRLCPRLGCSGLYDPTTDSCSKCGSQARKLYGWQDDSERGTRHQRGYDNAWLKLRQHKLAEQPLCETCLAAGHTVEATEVHHVIPFRGKNDPLRLDYDNLRSLCTFCHREKQQNSKGRGGSTTTGGR